MSGPWVALRWEMSDGTGVNAYVLDSGRPGDHVVILGGVHGDEINGTLGASEVVRRVTQLRRGRLTVIPVSNEGAQSTFARVSPSDGMNLARCFPGRSDGSPTEQLAALITDRALNAADVLIDLHTASAEVDMPLFAGCVDDGSRTGAESVALARTFGLPVLWTHPDVGPGRTITVAHERSIPALYVESPGGGIGNRRTVDYYARGCMRVLASRGLLDIEVKSDREPAVVHGNGDVDTFSAATHTGFFVTAVDLLDAVLESDHVGDVVDAMGQPLQRVTAPTSGLVMTLRRTAAVRAGDPLVGVAGVANVEESSAG